MIQVSKLYKMVDFLIINDRKYRLDYHDGMFYLESMDSNGKLCKVNGGSIIKKESGDKISITDIHGYSFIAIPKKITTIKLFD